MGDTAKTESALKADAPPDINAIINIHAKPLLRYAARILDDSDAAQAVILETFLKLLRLWRGGGQPTGNLLPWLYRVAHTTAIEYERRMPASRRISESAEASPAPQTAGGGDSAANARLTLKNLWQLAPDERQTSILRIQEKLSLRQISLVTGKSEDDAARILNNAVTKTSAALKAAGLIQGLSRQPDINCKPIYDLLVAHSLGDTDAEQSDMVRLHLAGCAACRQASEEIQQALHLLRAALADKPSAPKRLSDKSAAILKKTIERLKRGDRRSLAGCLIWCLVAGAIILVLAGLLLPNLSRARDSARRVNDLSNLNGLWKAASGWGLNPEHPERAPFPAMIEEAVEGVGISPEMLRSVSTGEPVEYYPPANAADGDRPLLVSQGKGGRNVVKVGGQGTWIADGTPEATALTKQLADLRQEADLLAQYRALEKVPEACEGEAESETETDAADHDERPQTFVDHWYQGNPMFFDVSGAIFHKSSIEPESRFISGSKSDEAPASVAPPSQPQEPEPPPPALLGKLFKSTAEPAAATDTADTAGKDIAQTLTLQRSAASTRAAEAPAGIPALPSKPSAAQVQFQKQERASEEAERHGHEESARLEKEDRARISRVLRNERASQHACMPSDSGRKIQDKSDEKPDLGLIDSAGESTVVAYATGTGAALPKNESNEQDKPESDSSAVQDEKEAGGHGAADEDAAPSDVPISRAFGVNPFVSAAGQPFSTFSIDVDTASYTMSRNYLLRGQLPPPEAVRTEEFVNYFDYAYAPPKDASFAVHTECGPSAFGRGLALLKIGVKGRTLGREEKRPLSLTLLIDTSGSMSTPDRIGMVKDALKLMIDGLSPADRVAIVQYDSRPRLALAHTPASERKKILAVIDGLQTSGTTSLAEGMRLAYGVAARGFDGAAINRVLLLSDGVANLGTTDAGEILKSIEAYRKQGVTLSVFGFGFGSYNDTMLETLANKGDGIYTFIDSIEQAGRVLGEDFSATVNLIARDVKIQVEFNPKRVRRYRQLGYENRKLAKEAFRDDSVDAGEVGSGQSATALYELDLIDAPGEPLGTVRVRCRNALSGLMEEIEAPMAQTPVSTPFEAMDARFLLAAASAEFAEILRGSPFAAGSSLDDVARVLRPVAMELSLDGRIQEMLRLTQTGLTPVFDDLENDNAAP